MIHFIALYCTYRMIPHPDWFRVRRQTARNRRDAAEENAEEKLRCFRYPIF